MAITHSGIEGWQRDGFESRIIKEIKYHLEDHEKRHKEEMRDLRSEMRHLSKRLEHINGFYVWLIDTYPETVAQYKALIDLQKVADDDCSDAEMEAGP